MITNKSDMHRTTELTLIQFNGENYSQSKGQTAAFQQLALLHAWKSHFFACCTHEIAVCYVIMHGSTMAICNLVIT